MPGKVPVRVAAQSEAKKMPKMITVGTLQRAVEGTSELKTIEGITLSENEEEIGKYIAKSWTRSLVNGRQFNAEVPGPKPLEEDRQYLRELFQEELAAQEARIRKEAAAKNTRATMARGDGHQRVDEEALASLAKLHGTPDRIGPIPGFKPGCPPLQYRTLLSLVGLHSEPEAGISYIHDGEQGIFATSIVMQHHGNCRGYSDTPIGSAPDVWSEILYDAQKNFDEPLEGDLIKHESLPISWDTRDPINYTANQAMIHTMVWGAEEVEILRSSSGSGDALVRVRKLAREPLKIRLLAQTSDEKKTMYEYRGLYNIIELRYSMDRVLRFRCSKYKKKYT